MKVKKINKIYEKELQKKVDDFIHYYSLPITDEDGEEEIKIKHIFQKLEHYEKILLALKAMGLQYSEICKAIHFSGSYNTVRVEIIEIINKIKNNYNK